MRPYSAKEAEAELEKLMHLYGASRIHTLLSLSNLLTTCLLATPYVELKQAMSTQSNRYILRQLRGVLHTFGKIGILGTD